MTPGLRRFALLLLVGQVLAAGGSARAGLRPSRDLGGVASFTLVTTKGYTRAVEELRGRVVILAYEDRGTRRVNNHLKRAIERLLRRRPGLRREVVVVPVSNVADYDFWPARYFARSVIKGIARRRKIEIWLDWERVLQKRLGLRDEASNFALLDRRGRLRYHRWGRFSRGHVQELLALVQKLARQKTGK